MDDVSDEGEADDSSSKEKTALEQLAVRLVGSWLVHQYFHIFTL